MPGRELLRVDGPRDKYLHEVRTVSKLDMELFNAKPKPNSSNLEEVLSLRYSLRASQLANVLFRAGGFIHKMPIIKKLKILLTYSLELLQVPLQYLMT